MVNKSTTEGAVFSVSETATYLKLDRNSIYAAIERGDIYAVRIGKRLLVPKDSLEKMLTE